LQAANAALQTEVEGLRVRMAQAGELQAVADGIEGSLQEALLQASARSNHHARS